MFNGWCERGISSVFMLLEAVWLDPHWLTIISTSTLTTAAAVNAASKHEKRRSTAHSRGPNYLIT